MPAMPAMERIGPRGWATLPLCYPIVPWYAHIPSSLRTTHSADFISFSTVTSLPGRTSRPYPTFSTTIPTQPEWVLQRPSPSGSGCLGTAVLSVLAKRGRSAVLLLRLLQEFPQRKTSMLQHLLRPSLIGSAPALRPMRPPQQNQCLPLQQKNQSVRPAPNPHQSLLAGRPPSSGRDHTPRPGLHNQAGSCTSRESS